MKIFLRKINALFRIVIVLFTILIVSGCGNDAGSSDNYKVTFVYDNGSSDVIKEVSKGETVTMPLQPEKEDYEFLGWYLENEEYDFSNPVQSDLTIKARYQIDESLAKTYTVSFVVDGIQIRAINVLEDRCVSRISAKNITGYEFLGWSLYSGKEEIFDFGTQIKKDLVLYAYYKPEKMVVEFNVEGEITTLEVDYDSKVDKPTDPTREGKKFYAWFLGDKEYNFDSIVTSNITLVAKFKRQSGVPCIITYDFGYDCYQTKEEFKLDFYTDFYEFLLTTDCPFEDYGIESLNDFLVFMDTFKYNGINEMAAIGTAFGKYYLNPDFGGTLEDQPETVFVGYISKQGKYVDYFKHMEVFFEYWRTDEGCSQGDPFKNDFYADPWASMVDTAKFFYFDGDTLQTKFDGIYNWFRSERVKYALDHIPGVGYVRLTTVENIEEYVQLPNDVVRDGYVFLGWYDSKEGGNKVDKVYTSMTVYAHWQLAE